MYVYGVGVKVKRRDGEEKQQKRNTQRAQHGVVTRRVLFFAHNTQTPATWRKQTQTFTYKNHTHLILPLFV
jgi:hypothetical protein